MCASTNSAADEPRGLSGPPAHGEILVLLFGLTFPVGLTYVFFVLLADAPSWVQRLAGGGLKSIQFLLPLFWVWGVLRQRVRPFSWSTRGLLPGVLFGGLAAAAMVVGYRWVLTQLGVLSTLELAVRQKVGELGFVSQAQFLALSLFYTLAHSLLEEYYWRWFIFGRLMHQVRLAAAVTISAVGFTLHHVVVLGKFFGYGSPATWIGAAGVCAGGVVWAMLYQRTERLLVPWCSHAIVDAAIFWIGYQLLFS